MDFQDRNFFHRVWMGPIPPFSLTTERYDQSTYYGRLMKMLNVCDPSILLLPEAGIREAVSKIDTFANTGKLDGISDAEMWHYRKIKDSAVNLDSGQIIPLPFRMSGYVPFNGPVCVGLIMARRTPWILFWQWMNQSQNALVNYYNRNGTNTGSDKVLVASYFGAVTSAISIAYGLSRAVKTFASPEKANTLLKFIALPTSIVASSVNCVIMRWSETQTGIKVYTSDGEEVGNSRAAASKAIRETVVSRMLLQVPVFVFPPLMTMLPPISRFLKRNPRFSTPIMTGFLFLGFGLGLPASIAAFPQEGEIAESQLESETLQGRGNLKYNKGL